MIRSYKLEREYTPGRVTERIMVEERDDEVVIERGGSSIRLPKSASRQMVKGGMSFEELSDVFKDFPSFGELLRGLDLRGLSLTEGPRKRG